MIDVRAFAVRSMWWRSFPRTSVRCFSRQEGHIEPPRPPRFQRHRRLVSTLDPSLITPADYMDLSGRSEFIFHSGAGDSEGLRRLLYYVKRKDQYIPFPDDTHGFIYYCSQPHINPMAGSVRFRVTQDNAPSSFARGHDLLTVDGAPWQMILPQIACRPSWAWIASHLLRDGLVTDDLLSRCREVFRERGTIHPHKILFTFQSTFVAHFSSGIELVLAADTLHPLYLKNLFTTIAKGKRYAPWTGSALARFEPSTFPEYAGRRVIHLRFLKVLDPATPLVDLQTYRGRMQEPREGELFTVSHYGRLPKPWAYDIDASKSKFATAFRRLWDISEKT
ncbi:hypothetical protein B0H15DRAFT_952345 [Mycena belliarum]|uniref:Uncharacterized protein n=1 Tax=Mycena belliarum TaxID=1033014 RepID=A0AAD6U2H2_9AGAR|nr:hypothetical protein B0H15DRAFT_952345 [Mycena belliae]